MRFPGHRDALKYVCGCGSAQTTLGSLQHSPRPHSWIKGGILLRGREERKRVEREGRERRGVERRYSVATNKNLPLNINELAIYFLSIVSDYTLIASKQSIWLLTYTLLTFFGSQ